MCYHSALISVEPNSQNALRQELLKATLIYETENQGRYSAVTVPVATTVTTVVLTYTWLPQLILQGNLAKFRAFC